jgi:hypothetical protein
MLLSIFSWPALSLFSCSIVICSVASIVFQSVFDPTCHWYQIVTDTSVYCGLTPDGSLHYSKNSAMIIYNQRTQTHSSLTCTATLSVHHCRAGTQSVHTQLTLNTQHWSLISRHNATFEQMDVAWRQEDVTALFLESDTGGMTKYVTPAIAWRNHQRLTERCMSHGETGCNIKTHKKYDLYNAEVGGTYTYHWKLKS